MIIYALSNSFLYCASNNRSTTIILDGETDRERPRTEITVIEDLAQLEKIKNKNEKASDTKHTSMPMSLREVSEDVELEDLSDDDEGYSFLYR